MSVLETEDVRCMIGVDGVGVIGGDRVLAERRRETLRVALRRLPLFSDHDVVPCSHGGVSPPRWCHLHRVVL